MYMVILKLKTNFCSPETNWHVLHCYSKTRFHFTSAASCSSDLLYQLFHLEKHCQPK